MNESNKYDIKKDSFGTQFKPGHPGGPGRPKGSREVRCIIRDFFEQDIPWEDIEGKPKSLKVIDACLAQQIKAALKGDKDALDFLLDRSIGKVPVRSFISGDPENPHGVVINVNRPALPGVDQPAVEMVDSKVIENMVTTQLGGEVIPNAS